MCVIVTFSGFVQNVEDEMGGFEKSAKTTHTQPRVPFQTKTRARAAAEVSVAETIATILPTLIDETRLVVGGTLGD